MRFAAQPIALSPNGDGFKDRTRIGFDLSEPATVSFIVVDQDGNEVRTLVDDRPLAGDTKHRFTWDGRDDDGRLVPDGTYRMRVIRRDEGRVIDSYKKLRVDTVAPTAAADARDAERDRARRAGPAAAACASATPGRATARPRCACSAPTTARRAWSSASAATATAARPGTARVRGRPAVDGDYAFSFSVRDSAGNLAVAPAEIPTPRNARPNTGVTGAQLRAHRPARRRHGRRGGAA